VSGVAERLRAVHERIEGAARRAGRDPGEVQLVAVSKTFGPELVLEAIAAGVRTLGENRVQEAAKKIPEIRAGSDAAIEWHLIGALQRNKARRAVELFDVIESVDRAPLVEAIAHAASALGRRLRVLLQVNLEDETQKAGARPEDAPALLAQVDAHPELEPVGLMAIPRLAPDPEKTRPSFARLRELRDALNRDRAPERRLRELSMGMSADFEVAIEEGATWVRIGTAIFGQRPPQ
jgi:pyridoxal phosphate enzyme (YggS family)